MSQPRIRQEALAVEEILLRVQRGSLIWIASSALQSEFMRNANPSRRNDSLHLLRFAQEFRVPDRFCLARAKHLTGNGYGDLDALHLAIAEDAKADFLITTDDRFLRKVRRGVGNPTVAAINPINWI